jgi:hypothetical protein
METVFPIVDKGYACLATVLSVSDLPDSSVELYVQAFAQRDWHTAVPVPHRQVRTYEKKESIINRVADPH